MIDFSSRAFIFDMDGTLVDNMHVHTAAWRILLEENGVAMDEHKFLVATAGRTNREIIPEVFLNIPDERITELAERKESLYREGFLPHRKPISGVIDFLAKAKKLGIRMAVATAASNANMEYILDGLDIRQYFQAVTTATDVTTGKPDPAMFLVSAEKLGVKPENCVVFEDALGGFEAARRANMKAIGIATVNSIDDIMKAEAVVEAHLDFEGLDPREIVERYVPFSDNNE
ncbi:MAG TPA: HAD family phosphatase [Pyrinomonadaceae bacterium]|nr:HAD family phosphatase [Pyrinomonadaceae bacterium]